MIIYMAHPFGSRHEMRTWELEAEKKYPVDIINPFYDLPRSDVEAIDAGQQTHTHRTPEDIVEQDTDCILHSDAVLAYVGDFVSYGTIMEMVYARVFDKPVYLLCSTSHRNHPWLLYHSKWQGQSLKDVERWLINICGDRA